jgi:hypothetical protein
LFFKLSVTPGRDALIRALWQRLEAAERRITDLEATLDAPSKTPDNASLPPTKGQKPNQPEKAKRIGPRIRPFMQSRAENLCFCRVEQIPKIFAVRSIA